MSGVTLRALLRAGSPQHLLEAHNALSATIVQEAGFAGVWASSLTMSCAHGVRDDQELTMTQALDTLESMAERVEIPILFDGGTGYGGLNHVRALVTKLCTRGIAGVCLEDKAFPKRNSFIASEQQALAPVAEFCGKLRVAADARTNPDFVIVARTEAIIVGLGVDEAVRRARHYAAAGADAILVHSKAPVFTEVAAFMERWREENQQVPVVCVPTMYYSTPPAAFAEAGISLVIWANHMMRASVAGMQQAAADIRARGTARDIVDSIVPVSELFRLQDSDGMDALEREYGARGGTTAVVLAASRGAALGELTADRPKCMIPVAGEPVLHRLLRQLRAEGVRDIAVVRGYRGDVIEPAGVRCFDNPAWDRTGELGSLLCARHALGDDILVLYGDIVIKRYILHEILNSDADITIAVDCSGRFRGSPRAADRVRVSGPPGAAWEDARYALLDMNAALPDELTDGEWTGIVHARGGGARAVRDALDAIAVVPGGVQLDMTALLNEVIRAGHSIRVEYVNGGWFDIDELSDMAIVGWQTS